MEVFSLEAVVNILTGAAKTQLVDLEKEAKKTGTGLSTAFEKASIGLNKFVFTPAFGVLTGVIAKIAADAVSMGITLNDSFKTLQVQTGATNTRILELKESFKELWKSGPDASKEIVDSLNAVEGEMGDLGDKTVEVADSFMDFADVVGGDVATNVDQVNQLLQNYGLTLEDLTAVQDRFAKIQQVTGKSSVELIATLNEGQAVFSAFGMGLNEASVLMGGLQDKNIPLNQSMQALRNLMNAATGGTVEAARAFETLGIKTDAANKPMATLPEIFKRVALEAPNAVNSQEKLLAIQDLFGGKVTAKMVQALATGADSFAALGEAADKSAGTIKRAGEIMDESLSARMAIAWRSAMGDSIAEIAEAFVSFFEWLLPNVGYAVDAFKMFGQQLGLFFQQLEEAWQTTMAALNAAAADFAQKVLRVFIGVFQVIQQGLDQFAAQSDAWGGIYGPLAEAAKKGSAGIDDLNAKMIEFDKTLEKQSVSAKTVAESMGELWNAMFKPKEGGTTVPFMGLPFQLPGVPVPGTGGEKSLQDLGIKPGAGVGIDPDNLGATLPGAGGGGGAGAGGGGKDPSDLNAQIALIEKRIALQKSSAREELAAAEKILEAGKKRGLVAQDLAALEEKVFAIKQKANAEEVQAMEANLQKRIALGQAGADDEIKLIQKVLDADLIAKDQRLAKEVELAQKTAALQQAREDLDRKINAVGQSTTDQRRAALKAEDEQLRKAGIDEFQRNRYRAVQEKQIAEDQRKFEAGIRAETLSAIGHETEARLVSLEQQYEEHRKNAKNKAQIDQWYQAQVEAVLDQERHAHEALRQDVLRFVQGETEARKAALELQYQDLKKTRQDQVAVEQWYKAEKAKIDQDQADATRNVTTKTAQIQGKQREVTLRGIEDEVRAMREGGAKEVAVLEFIEARRKQFFEEERKRKDAARGFDFTTGTVTMGVEAAFEGGLSTGASKLGEGFFSKRDTTLSESEARFSKLKRKPVKTDANGNPLEVPDSQVDAAGAPVEKTGQEAAKGKDGKTTGKDGKETTPDPNLPESAPITMRVEVLMGGKLEILEAKGDVDAATLGGLFGSVNLQQHLQGTKSTRNGRQ